jgi:hypothetical protein
MDSAENSEQIMNILTKYIMYIVFPYGMQCYSNLLLNNTTYTTWWGSCYSIFSFMCMSCRSFFLLLYFFLLTIVLSVLLRYRVSDYPFGIFKLLTKSQVYLCPLENLTELHVYTKFEDTRGVI